MIKLGDLFSELVFDHQEIILISQLGDELRGNAGAMRAMLSAEVLDCMVSGLEGLDNARMKVWVAGKEKSE